MYKRVCLVYGVVAALALLLASCGTVIYQPRSVALPLISHQGEWRLDAATGAGLALTASYGVTDRVAAQVHLTSAIDGYYLQATPGWYKRVGNSGVVECYAGVGFGQMNSNYLDNPFPERVITNSMVMPFVQTNAGWRDDHSTEVAFGLKVGGVWPNVRMRNYAIDTETGVPYVASQEDYTKPGLLIEPHVQFRFGRKRLRYTLRLSYAWMSSIKLTLFGYNRLAYMPFMISHGISYTF